MSLFPRLRAGSRSAALIAYKYVRLRSGVPDGRDAHENADEFVSERSGYRVVRGWLLSPAGILDKHVVVENIQTGERFDVTPLDTRVAFFEHPGTAEEFDGLWCQISMPPYSPPVRLVVPMVDDVDPRNRVGGTEGETSDDIR